MKMGLRGNNKMINSKGSSVIKVTWCHVLSARESLPELDHYANLLPLLATVGITRVVIIYNLFSIQTLENVLATHLTKLVVRYEVKLMKIIQF